MNSVVFPSRNFPNNIVGELPARSARWALRTGSGNVRDSANENTAPSTRRGSPRASPVVGSRPAVRRASVRSRRHEFVIRLNQFSIVPP